MAPLRICPACAYGAVEDDAEELMGGLCSCWCHPQNPGLGGVDAGSPPLSASAAFTPPGDGRGAARLCTSVGSSSPEPRLHPAVGNGTAELPAPRGELFATSTSSQHEGATGVGGYGGRMEQAGLLAEWEWVVKEITMCPQCWASNHLPVATCSPQHKAEALICSSSKAALCRDCIQFKGLVAMPCMPFPAQLTFLSFKQGSKSSLLPKNTGDSWLAWALKSNAVTELLSCPQNEGMGLDR